MSELRMIFRLLRMSAKAQVMYKTDFLIGILGTLAYNATFLASIGIITSRFGAIGGFKALEIVLLYALFEISHGVYGLFLMNMSSYISRQVVDGTLDVYFLRPYSILTQLNGAKMNYTAFVDIFIGFSCFGYATIGLGVDWGLRWLMLPVFIISGCFIEFALSLLMNCMTVLSPNLRSLYSAYYQIVLIGQRYPLNLFAKGFQGIMTFLFPLGFVNYYPLLFLTGRSGGWLGFFSPLVAFVFALFAIRVFSLTLSRYSSTGS